MTVSQMVEEDPYDKTVLGFWIYLMTDCILFATLFTTFAVLHTHTFGEPPLKELVKLPTSLTETLVLLASSFSCGMGVLAACRKRRGWLITWFCVAFAFGLAFLFLEFNEFRGLVAQGYSWRRSAALSSFFTLVGTHGLHVSVGMLWMTIMMLQVGFLGITATTFRRLVCFSMFWHFLDVVWIFIFTFVYLIGATG